jgi:hypothetical protein
MFIFAGHPDRVRSGAPSTPSQARSFSYCQIPGRHSQHQDFTTAHKDKNILARFQIHSAPSPAMTTTVWAPHPSQFPQLRIQGGEAATTIPKTVIPLTG